MAPSTIRGVKQGEIRPTEKVRREDGMLNRARIVRLTEHLIPRSRKRQNTGGSEGPGRGYGLCVLRLIRVSTDLESQPIP